MIESTGNELPGWSLVLNFDLLHKICQRLEAYPRNNFFSRQFSRVGILLEAMCHCHSLKATWPIKLPHFCFMCLPHRWSLVHLSLKALHTLAILHNSAIERRSKMDSKANSGKSNKEIPSSCSIFSSSELTDWFTSGGIVETSKEVISIGFFVKDELRKWDNSIQNQDSDDTLIPVFQAWSLLREKDLESNKMNEKQEITKKIIWIWEKPQMGLWVRSQRNGMKEEMVFFAATYTNKGRA